MCVLFGGFSADGVTQDDLKSPRLGRRDVDTTGVSQIAWETRRTTHLILFEGAAILGLRNPMGTKQCHSPQGIANKTFNTQGCLFAVRPGCAPVSAL